MRVKESSFVGEKDFDIFYQVWEPDEGPAKAVILLLHGYAEHSGRYLPLGEYLTDRGYKIYAPDHRAHGRSDGEKALIDDMDNILADLQRLLDIARGENPGKKIFVIGHSMGGLLAICFATAQQERLAGIVLSAPGIMIGAGVSGFVKAISGILATMAPRMGVQELDSAWLSHDPAVAKWYDEDPLNYRGKVMAKTGAEMLRKADWALQHVSEITIPVLCLHGSEDKLADPAGSQYVYDHVSSRDKTIRIFDGLYHEIFNEYEKEEIYQIVADWLDAHCGEM